MQKGSILLKLSPLLLPFLVLFGGGLLLTVFQSLGYLLPVPSDYSGLDAYREVLFDAWFWKSFLFSVHVGFASALLAVTAGTVLAYLISRLPRVMQTYANVYKVPLILPHIAVAFVTMLFLGKSGVIASVCYQFGIIETMQDFPTLIFSPTGFGVIAAYTYKGAAFAMLLVLAILRKLDERILDTARMLGASGTTIFFRIVLPFLRPVIQTTFLILFLYNFGAFEIPYLLGESHPGMLSVQVFNLYFMRELTERPLAMAMLVVMFVFGAVFIGLYAKLVERLDARQRKL